jgi:hypothetical protein
MKSRALVRTTTLVAPSRSSVAVPASRFFDAKNIAPAAHQDKNTCHTAGFLLGAPGWIRTNEGRSRIVYSDV